MKLEYDNEGQLFDTRYSKNEDVRRVQEALRKGDGIEKVYSSMGFDKKYARQIIRYIVGQLSRQKNRYFIMNDIIGKEKKPLSFNYLNSYAAFFAASYSIVG